MVAPGLVQSLALLLSAIETLRGHHSWHAPNLPRVVRQVIMGWHCGQCNIPNQAQAEFCSTCGQHWGAVWQRREKRSVSKPKSKKDSRKERKEKDKPAKDKGTEKSAPSEENNGWQVFPTSVPWVTTTPQARLPNPKPSEGTSSIPDIPPQPVLQPPPPPPAASAKQMKTQLTQEEQEVLKHLRGLQSLGAELPPQFQLRLTALELKEKEQDNQKPLSHGHLNRLHKLQGQVQSQLGRIQKLDTEWKAFLDFVNGKMAMHVEMYKTCRHEMVTTYQNKIQELQEVKASVTAASQSLMDAAERPQEPPAPPEVDQDIQQFQQAVLMAGQEVQQVDSDVEDMEEVQEDVQEDGKITGTKQKALIPFRGATSPNKVTNLHLKAPTKQGEGATGAYEDEAHQSHPHPVCLPFHLYDDSQFEWLDTDAAFRYQAVEEAFHESLVALQAALTKERHSWTASAIKSALRIGPPQDRKRVNFSDQATLHIWDGERDGQCPIELTNTTQQLRTMWHLHGQIVDADLAFALIRKWQDPSQRVWGPAVSRHSQVCLPCGLRENRPNANERIETAEARMIHPSIDGWNDLQAMIAARPSERHHFVGLWYLNARGMRTCLRSRNLLITADTTAEEMQRASIFVWQDLIEWEVPIRFVPVRPRPDTLTDAVAHFILVQDPTDWHTGMMLCSDAFPPLRKHRAVLLPPDATVSEVYATAQADWTCGDRIICYVHGPNRENFCTNGDRVLLDEGKILFGNYRTVPAEEDDAGDDSASDAEDDNDETASTVLLTDDDHASETTIDDWDNISLLQVEDHQDSTHEESHAHEPIPWNELPMDFRVADVMDWEGDTPSWITLTQTAARAEHVHPTEVSELASACQDFVRPSWTWPRGQPNQDMFAPADNCEGTDSLQCDSVSFMQAQAGQSSARRPRPAVSLNVSDDLPPVSHAIEVINSQVQRWYAEDSNTGTPFHVAAWFVSIDSPHCNTPRWSLLPDHILMWEDAILDPWMHDLDTSQGYQMEVIDPSAWFSPQANVVHVWITQSPLDSHRPLFLVPHAAEAHAVLGHTLVLAPAEQCLSQVLAQVLGQRLPPSLTVDSGQSTSASINPLLTLVRELQSMQVVVHITLAHSPDSDVTAMMQRDRSRSGHRHAGASDRKDPADDRESSSPDQPQEPEESDDEAAEDLETWKLVYTSMPEDPAPVQAGGAGPSASQAAQAIGFPLREIRNIHIVHSLHRQLLDSIALIECVEDHMRDDESAILFDIMCDPDAGRDAEPQVFHAMMLTRNSHTYASFIGSVRLTRFQRLHPTEVIVLHNGDIWRPGDPRPRSISNGDHLQVSFGPTRRGSHAVALIDWLLDEGITPWPSLLAARDNQSVSPTIPFSIRSEHDGMQISAFECPEQRQGAGFAGIAFNSWFIGHARWPRCESSRVVIFSQDQNSWKQSLQRIWADRFDPTRPYLVTWVSPRPTNLGLPEYDLLPHVIIEQEFIRGRVSALLSVTSLRPTHPGVTHVAVSAGDRMEVRGYLELAQIADVCGNLIQCTVSHDGRTLTDSEIVFRPSGCTFDITIEHAPRLTALLEESSMLQVSRGPQTSITSAAAADQPDTGSTPMTTLAMRPAEGGPCCSFDGDPIQSYLLEQTYHLQVREGQHAGSLSTYVATYFLSPDGWPTCPFARNVELVGDPGQWRNQILSAWQGALHPLEDTQVYIVHPSPHQQITHSGILAYVLVVQFRGTVQNPVLVTRGEQGEYIHVAMLVPLDFDRFVILNKMDLVSHCIGPGRRFECLVRHGALIIETGHFVRLPAGSSVHVELVQRIEDATSTSSQHLDSPDSYSRHGHPPQPASKGEQTLNETAVPISIRKALAADSRMVKVIHIDRSLAWKTMWIDRSLLHRYKSHGSQISDLWQEEDGTTMGVVIATGNPAIVYVPKLSVFNDATSVHIEQVEPKQTKETQQLKFLYRQGVRRAVLHPPWLHDSDRLRVCHYTHQDPSLQQQERTTKAPTPWPDPQPPVESLQTVTWLHGLDTEIASLSIPLPCHPTCVHDMLHAEWISLTAHTHGLGLEEQFVLQGPATIDWETFDRIVILTDGSAKHGGPTDTPQMGWAFIVLGEVYGNDAVFLGWAGDPVILDPDDSRHIHSHQMHSTRAETEALLWAISWRLSRAHAKTTAFLTDSMVGKGVATGTASTNGDQPSILLRSGALALRQSQGHQGPLIDHVRAHSGHFWNELVDRLAGYVRSLEVPRGHVQPPTEHWQQVYCHLPMLIGSGAASIDHHSGSIVIPKPHLPTRIDPASVGEISQTPTQQRIQVRLRCASGNVQSLYASATGGKGKIAYLQDQLHAASLHLIGLQETRGHEGAWDTANWLRLAASGNKGNHGVELWVNKAIAYGWTGDRPHFFAKSHFAVVAKNPRWLLIKLDAPGLQEWILVAHAPHGGIKEDSRQDWWHQLSELLHHWQASDRCLVFLDANATTGGSARLMS
eukprot:Skav224537  [mRNA]  locus=scaffold388:790655:798229:+ [translate_table: standard]